eukprot:90344-Pleurochrysis_carterae.AAC.3
MNVHQLLRMRDCIPAGLLVGVWAREAEDGDVINVTNFLLPRTHVTHNDMPRRDRKRERARERGERKSLKGVRSYVIELKKAKVWNTQGDVMLRGTNEREGQRARGERASERASARARASEKREETVSYTHLRAHETDSYL